MWLVEGAGLVGSSSNEMSVTMDADSWQLSSGACTTEMVCVNEVLWPEQSEALQVRYTVYSPHVTLVRVWVTVTGYSCM
jgi:hypothetical protein